ncbi:nuclear pore complex protein NUP133 [Trifolium repens]|nr:nuclear pore complex protein NUP133 [Trifolium repens]
MNPKTNFLSLFSTSFFSFTICIAIGDHRAGNHHSRKASFTSQDEESQAFHPTLEKTTEATKVPGYALQIILEHGEKLSAMIQLRELQNLISQNRSTSVGSSNSNVDIQMSGALWDMIQLVDALLEYVTRPEHKFAIQIQRACELPNACVSIIRTCFDYKNENLLWYPPPEGFTPWYCQPIVRKGIWSVGSVLIQLLNDTSRLDRTAKLFRSTRRSAT